jgi:hypothetical protein
MTPTSARFLRLILLAGLACVGCQPSSRDGSKPPKDAASQGPDGVVSFTAGAPQVPETASVTVRAIPDSFWRLSDTVALSGWQPLEIQDVKDRVGMALGSAILFRNGRRVATGVVKAELMALLARRRGAPFMVLGGRECDACDAGWAVFIEAVDRPDSDPILNAPQFPYPGRVLGHDDADDSLRFESRMFVGQCLSQLRPAVMWFSKDYTATAGGGAQVHVVEVVEDTLVTRDLEPPLPPISAVTGRITAGRCREVAGKEHVAGW